MKKLSTIILSMGLLIFLVSCEFIPGFETKYTVRFHYHIDNAQVSDEREYKKDELIDEPVITKDNYILVGWYKDLEQEDSKWTFSTDVITSNLILHAKWELEELAVAVSNLKITNNILTWDSELDATYQITINNEIIDLDTNTFDLSLYQTLFSKDLGEKIIINPIKENHKSVSKEVTITYNEEHDEALNIDFEDLSQNSYLTGLFEDEGIKLNVSDFLVGTKGNNDNTNGQRAGRIRNNGFIETVDPILNFYELSYYIASYSSHASSSVNLYIKNVGEDYILVRTNETTSTPTEVIVNKTDLTNNGIDLTKAIIIKIEKTSSNNTANIDDIIVKQNPKGVYILKEETVQLTDYYRSVEGLEGEELVLELRFIISANITNTSYGEARDILAVSDRDPNDNYNSLRGMYDQDKIATHWIGKGEGSWQREHVWPNSKLGMGRVANSNRNQASDIHNLRAITGVNQTRSNRFFTEGIGAYTTVDANAFYPGDIDKGDVARILMYMAVRYDFLKLTSNETLLTNNKNTNYKVEGAYGGRLDLLLDWHLADPVDQLEINRNELFYSGSIDSIEEAVKPQGNRNPFIDHPELFNLVFEYFTQIDNARKVSYHYENNHVLIDYTNLRKKHFEIN